MQKWEYYRIRVGYEAGEQSIFAQQKPGRWVAYFSDGNIQLDECLEQLGDQGWELVGVWGENNDRFIFKRPLNE